MSAVAEDHSEELGWYLEYREKWRYVAGPVVCSSLVVVYLAYVAGTARGTETCIDHWKGGAVPLHCYTTSAQADALGAGLLAAIAFGYLLFLLRKLTRPPVVRVGDLGVEDRTHLIHDLVVRWQDVQSLQPSRRLDRSAVLHVRFRAKLTSGRPPVNVRTGGMSASAHVVEGQMEKAYRRFHRLPDRPYQPVERQKGALPGIDLHTKDETLTSVTRADLRHVTELLRGDDFITLRSAQRGKGKFVQARRSGHGAWRVEYRDGSADRHYAAECATDAEVFDVFISWIRDERAFPALLPWRRMAAEELATVAGG